MPKINRSKTTYANLPEDLATSTIPDAKLMASINVTVPKGMEKSAEKFIKEAHDYLQDGFKKYVKKEIKKRAGKKDD